MTVKKFFTKLKAKWTKVRLLAYLHKEYVSRLYRAVITHSNVCVGIGWVERKDQKDPVEEGTVKTAITYYNMRLYDVYHSFWHMTKRYEDELEKLREGRPLQIDDHTGRWFKYSVNLKVDEDKVDNVEDEEEE